MVNLPQENAVESYLWQGIAAVKSNGLKFSDFSDLILFKITTKSSM